MKWLFNAGKIGMAIGHTHHRMLLEDIMGLSLGGDEISIYLIHQSHMKHGGQDEFIR